LAKIANWFLGLVKKASASLLKLISSLFKKTDELVLFFFEYLIKLLLAIIVSAVEITRKKMLKTE